jgi:hypothetical protein
MLSTPTVRAVVSAVTVGVVVVVVVVVVVAVVVVASSEPQAASDRAIKETPPALAAFAFFFSQTRANFLEIVAGSSEAPISGRNAPVEIMFMFFAPYYFKDGIPSGLSHA